jgi:diguanylate cyclase (GGDEF)-like protein/PAS domain S-box-containing protein
MGLEANVLAMKKSLCSSSCTASGPHGVQMFFEVALDAILYLDQDGRVTAWNPQAQEMFGFSQEQALGREGADLVVLLDKRHALREAVARYRAAPTPTVLAERMEDRCMCANGNLLAVEITLLGVNQQGQRAFCVQVRDITERKQKETSLQVAAEVFDSREGMVVTDAHNMILRVNPTFCSITGYSPTEVLGKKISILSSGQQDAAFYQTMWANIQAHGAWAGEIWNRRKNGEMYAEWLTVTAIRNAQGTAIHYVGTFTDITQRKAAEAEITQLAFYDVLTGLPNRRLLMDRVQQTLASNHRRQRSAALLFIDLDRFKIVNDTLGHAQGDVMLRQVSERLKAVVREGDTVARLGGDEFVVMLQDLSDQQVEALDETRAVGGKILEALCQPYLLGMNTHHGGASIGATLFTAEENSAEALVQRADLAMYQAKAAGRNTLCIQ